MGQTSVLSGGVEEISGLKLLIKLPLDFFQL